MSLPDVREIDLYNEDGSVSVEQADGGRSMLLVFEQGNKVRRARINRRLLADFVAILGNANDCSSISWSRRNRSCRVGVTKGDAREVCSWPLGWKKPLVEGGAE